VHEIQLPRPLTLYHIVDACDDVRATPRGTSEDVVKIRVAELERSDGQATLEAQFVDPYNFAEGSSRQLFSTALLPPEKIYPVAFSRLVPVFLGSRCRATFRPVQVSRLENVQHAIKYNSPLQGKLLVGDKLLAIDDDDVKYLSAIDVSKIISRKSNNLQRKFTVLRSYRDGN